MAVRRSRGMDAAKKRAIRMHHQDLRTGVIVNNFLPSLHRDAGGFLTDFESQEVSSKTSNSSQIDELIQFLLTKEDKAFDLFCRILEKNDYQSWSEKLNSSASQDLESSEIVDIPPINDDVASEDDDLAPPVWEKDRNAEQLGSSRKKGTPAEESNCEAPENFPSATQISPGTSFENATMTEPSAAGRIVSSLDIVCYACLNALSIPKCIRKAGSCKEPSHVKIQCVWCNGYPYSIQRTSSGNILTKLCSRNFNSTSMLQCDYAHCDEEPSYWRDSQVLPPCEMCKDCRWKCCLSLVQCQCLSGTHDKEEEIVVYKDEEEKDLVEIRRPWNFLGMRNEQYHCKHSFNECIHRPIHNCGSPHTEIEQDTWNIWKGTATASAHRTARGFLTEIERAYTNVSFKIEKDRALLTVPLTATNYKGKFLLLNELEKEEHVQALERCKGSFAFTEYRHNSKSDERPNEHSWSGTLKVPQYLGDHVRQAASHVELEEGGGGWQLTGEIINEQKILNKTCILLVSFDKGRTSCDDHEEQHSGDQEVTVKAKFYLKYRYFENLQRAILKLRNAVIPKLMLERLPTLPSPTESPDKLDNLPFGFELDEEYQGPTCQQLLRSSASVPFLITGPFGTGKTRVIAAAAYCIMKQDPHSRILIATHHIGTADSFVESYFTEELVKREGLKVVRMVGKDPPPGRLSGLTKTLWTVNSTLHNFQLIITTFVQSLCLSQHLQPGHFTHIFIDEAAQAREPETIAAFSVAGRDTKIILAGDHMQVGPKTSVLGKEPRENGLSDSLLVRLLHRYRQLSSAASQTHRSELLINHRCHPAIVRLPSRLFYDCRVQTQAKSVPHPGWEKMVYFVCTSFDLRAPAAGNKWSTQKELAAEAELEVQELKRVVQEYIMKLPQKGGTISGRKSTSGVVLSEKDLSSICVMLPTRLTETLWKREVQHSSKLKQVTRAVVYNIQGREFDAVFVCTAQPVNEDYSPFDSVKSMCDPYMFNTIITRPKSLLVVIGNPFRLQKIEQKSPNPPACWSEYLCQCWEGGSLLLSANLRKHLGASCNIKKQLGKLGDVLFQKAAKKLCRVAANAIERELDKDREIDTIMTGHRGDSKTTAVQSNGWKLGRETQVMVVKDELVSGFHIECKLDGYTAIPTDPAQKPIVIPSIDKRRCAFDGATVVVEKTGRQAAGMRTGKVVSVIRQGPVEPMICSVDPLNPLILLPVNGKNPKIVNRPRRTEVVRVPTPTKETAIEAMVKCYSPECPTRSVDAIPFKSAHDMFFIVQPLEWSVQERYPLGAVIGILPKSSPAGLAEKILEVQHNVTHATNLHPDAANSRIVASPLSSLSMPEIKTAIGIRDTAGKCNITFSVEAKKDHYTVAVHVSNVADLVSGMEEFKKNSFSKWSASHPILPPDVMEACDFSKNSIQKAITVHMEFKVEEPLSIFSRVTRKNMMVAQPSVKLTPIRETVVQCSNMLSMSDTEHMLRSLQTGHAANATFTRGTAMSVHDALAILYCTAEHLHKTRHGHSGYPLLEMASYEFPETEKMVNELLTLANGEVAKIISKAFPDRALLVSQDLPDHRQEEIVQHFSEDLGLLPEPAIYPWLTPQGQTRSKPSQSCVIVSVHLLKALIAALQKMDLLEARQLLYFFHYHPQFAPLQEAIRSALPPETFIVGCSLSADSAPMHCIRLTPYTSITNPFRCIGDVYVQEQLLAAVRGDELPRSIDEVKEVAMHCNRARLNAKDYESARAKLKWACFAQQSSVHVQSVVNGVKNGVLHLCCQYDHQGNLLESIAVPASTMLRHSEYTAKVSRVDGLLQVPVGTTSEYQGGSGSSSVQVYGEGGSVKGNVSHSPLVPAQTVKVPTNTLHTVMECVNTFDEKEAAKALTSLLSLKKLEQQSHIQREHLLEPMKQDAHFILLECPLPLSPHQLVDVWMRMDTSQCIATPQPQLLEVGHSNVRVCLHHTEQPEACFTSGSTVQAPQQVHSSVESYVSEWTEVLLAEAACRSVRRKQHTLINDVLLQFNTFEALGVFASEPFYRPVGRVRALFPKAFMEDRQDIFPVEKGDLLCARYEVDLREDIEVGLEFLERHGNCFPPQHEPVVRIVLHMVVERVVVMEDDEDMLQEVMSQEVVQSGVEVYLMVVGEQGGRISPLMKDLLATNRHTCQLEVVPMEPKLRSVYQCLRRLPNYAAATKLAVDIMLGDVEAFDTARVTKHLLLDELPEECPRLEQLNAGQRAALERAYRSKFHIIQGPPGTEKLLVAVHLAYAFAQKNKQMGVRKATGKQCCVLLCAPDDAAVDATLSLLQLVAGFGEEDISLLRVYSREVERKHCPGPYQDTKVFEETASANYRVPLVAEKFALHKLISSKMAFSAQRSEYRWLVAEAERRVIQEGQFDVVLCTCSEASSARIQCHFIPFQCIVYEASLATEPETVAAIARSSHQVVLIGDHSSVCPLVCSKVARLAGLGVSLFERYTHQLTEEDEYELYSFLEEQYRMVEPLCDFPSHEFYKGQLRTSPTLSFCRYPGLDLFWPKGNGQPLVFCNVSGTEETDLHKPAEDAIANKREAKKVVEIVLKMVTVLSGGTGKFTKDTLAVLTTTEGQKSLIQQLLLQTSLDKNVMGLVRSQVMTISASRGAKANFVILSTVRSCPAGALPKDWTALLDHQWKEDHLGLLCQPHLTCLALTTGKHGLVIVGDVDLLSLDDKWCHLVKHCSDKGCLVQGDTFPSQQFVKSLQQAAAV